MPGMLFSSSPNRQILFIRLNIPLSYRSFQTIYFKESLPLCDTLLFVFITYLDLLLLMYLPAYFLSVNIISIMKIGILSVMLTVASWVAGTKLVLDKYLWSEEKGTGNRSSQ